MHAPENNYLIAKSKGGTTSTKMEEEFMPWIGGTWRIVEKDRFPFSVIYSFEIILEGRSARVKTTSSLS